MQSYSERIEFLLLIKRGEEMVILDLFIFFAGILFIRILRIIATKPSIVPYS